jgi:hypothetical protein
MLREDCVKRNLISFWVPFVGTSVAFAQPSMNLELPALYAGYFGVWFGGLPTSATSK